MYVFKLYWALSAATGCVSISDFACLDGIDILIASFALGLKVFVITAGITKYKLTINERGKKAW